MNLTPDTAARVRELAEATGRSEEEVLAGAVTLYAMHRLLTWTGGMAARAVEPAEEV